MTVFAAKIFPTRVNKDKLTGRLKRVQRLDKSSVDCRREASEGKVVLGTWSLVIVATRQNRNSSEFGVGDHIET